MTEREGAWVAPGVLLNGLVDPWPHWNWVHPVSGVARLTRLSAPYAGLPDYSGLRDMAETAWAESD